MPNKVFISYRREDSQYQAGRIYEAFVRALPPDTVFMDVDSMSPGDDFVEALEGWVQQCDVLLALIGPRWIDSTDPRTNLRRLDNPEDFVRIEIRGALERKIPVVPVLLDAAKMPTAAELPDDIKALPRRNAGFVDFRTFDTDVQRLIKRLKIGTKTELPSESPEPQDGQSGSPAGVATVNTLLEQIMPDGAGGRKRLLIAAAVASLLFALGAAAYAMRTWSQVDEWVAMADFTKSEKGRLTAEARASETSDALARTEKARQEAEAKATAATTALTTTEESRRAAEARAKDAEDAGKKFDKARLDAEARASSAAAAQARAEDGMRTADKARAAAEASARAAATARDQAEAGRQLAETRASAATEAVARVEKARQEAEAKLVELRKVADARPSPAPSSGQLLADVGRSRWVNSEGSCWATKNVYFLSPEVGNGTITWVNGLGNRTTEKIQISFENSFYTETRSYMRSGDKLSVTPKVGSAFLLERCP